LRGDGVTVPYYWVWIPTYTYAAAPPPPAVPPAAPADYPLGSIPAPPPPPAS
jgi:hypothetical protein